MQGYIEATIAEAMKKQEEARLAEENGAIPLPDPPISANSYSSEDYEDEDEETDYFKLKKQKEFYPRKGDVQRLKTNNFDEEVFEGDQEFTIIVFYAKFCKQCKHHAPSIRAAGRRYKEDPKVKIVAVNQEGNFDLSARFDLEPAQETIMFAKGKPETDGDLKTYEGEVSFAGLLQFIGSRGEEMIKVEKYVPTLYNNYGAGATVNQNLTWATFNETVFNPNKNVMVQFYAGWSEFCQIDARNYTVLAARMKRDHPDSVVIAAIDVDKHSDLADRFDITSLPAYWFANKTVTEDTQLLKYTGDHTGALVLEELYPFILSQGKTIPPGMQDEKPQYPRPWAEIKADLDKQKKEAAEKDAAEKKKHEEEAKKRKEKLAAKKAAMKAKKEAKKNKEEL
jgi:thioredoxin-like negative regulator of GroEL